MLEIDKIKEITKEITTQVLAVNGSIYFRVNIKINEETINTRNNIISKKFFINF